METMKDADLVIEAATENLALKHRIFADTEARVGDDAVITSNTSSLPASRIFAGLAHPERATVTHFFAPAWRNPAVEVIDWPGADPALDADAGATIVLSDVIADRVEAAATAAHAAAREPHGERGRVVIAPVLHIGQERRVKNAIPQRP